MAAKMPDERWYFTKEEIKNTPSIKAGMTFDKELMYRQQCANLIQDIGQKLSVNQLCISTAIVYMHRFYMHHSFIQFNRNSMAACSLFLAAKVEEQFRKVEHVVKVSYACQNKEKLGPLDTNSETFQNMATELINNESIMLQTLGFDITVDHPHSHVVKCCQLIRAPKDLAQVSYIMATNSLHLTLLSLEYRPSVVACVCIYIACKWSSWEIPRSTEGKDWFWYIDKDVDLPIIQGAMEEFMNIYVKSPHKLKMKLFRKDEPFERRLKSDDSNSTDAISDDLSDFPAAHQKFLNMYHQQHADHAKAAAAIAASANNAGQKAIPSLTSTSQASIRNSFNNLPLTSANTVPTHPKQQSLGGAGLPTYPKNSSDREKLNYAKNSFPKPAASNGHLPPPQAQQHTKTLYHQHYHATLNSGIITTNTSINTSVNASHGESSTTVVLENKIHPISPNSSSLKRLRTTCPPSSSSIVTTSNSNVNQQQSTFGVVKKAKTMSDLINETRSELKIKQQLLAHQATPGSPPALEMSAAVSEPGGGAENDYLAQTLESIQNQLLGNEPPDPHLDMSSSSGHQHHHKHRHHKSSSSSSKGEKKKKKDKKRHRDSSGDRAARPPMDDIKVAQPIDMPKVEGPQPPPPLPINPPPPLSPLPPLPPATNV